jgi:Na+-transporting NADH:ubiquinone oxidoreductase subunit C
VSQFNKNSNGFILVFAIVMTLLLGSILAFTSEGLKDKQAEEREFERQKFILAAAMGTENINEMASVDRKQVTSIYETQVQGLVVNQNGEVVEGKKAKDINVGKEYKKLQRNAAGDIELKPGIDTIELPVYKILKKGTDEAEYYVLPTYGFGLWDNIWGYVALQGDLNTVQGVIFDHKGETPGLGARITELGVQKRYQGKKLEDEGGEFQGVVMQKGEKNDYSGQPHKVDGMSGATITAVGLNNMFKDYMGLYSAYLETL